MWLRFQCDDVASCFQARGNRGWSTSASTSAFPATSVCLCASTTCQSDYVLFLLLLLFILPAKDQIFSSLSKKKKAKAKRPDASFDCFLCAMRPLAEPVKRPTLPVHFHPSEREEMETGCRGYLQKPVVTLWIISPLPRLECIYFLILLFKCLWMYFL